MEEKMRVIVITVFLLIGAAIAEDAAIEEEANNPAEDVGIGLLGKTETYESPKLKKLMTHCFPHVGEACSTSSSIGSEALMQNQDGLALCLFGSMERCLVDQGAKLHHPFPTPTEKVINYPRIPSIPQLIAMGSPVPPTDAVPFRPRPRVGTLGKVIRFPPVPPTKKNILTFPTTPSNVIPFPPRGRRWSKLDNHQVQHLPKLGPTSAIQRPNPTAASPPISPKDLSLLIETIQLRTVLRICTHVTARTCLTAPNVATSDLESCLTPSMNQCVYPQGAKSGEPRI